jgi:hypothetical protein
LLNRCSRVGRSSICIVAVDASKKDLIHFFDCSDSAD